MAITGCAMVIFVIGHMIGNLQIFLGPEAINKYAHLLQHTAAILWPARIGLLLIVSLHITAAIQLALENKAARPVTYEQNQYVAASYASRTMVMSGAIIATFIIYHLLHFTAQIPAINLTGQDFDQLVDATSRHDVFRMVIIGFRQPVVAGFYILGMLLLCLHLRHGVSSMAQSLGLKTATNGKVFEGLAWALAVIIFVGNCSIPIAILCGFGKEVLV